MWLPGDKITKVACKHFPNQKNLKIISPLREPVHPQISGVESSKLGTSLIFWDKGCPYSKCKFCKCPSVNLYLNHALWSVPLFCKKCFKPTWFPFNIHIAGLPWMTLVRIINPHRPLVAQLIPGPPKASRFSRITALWSPWHSNCELKVDTGLLVTKWAFMGSYGHNRGVAIFQGVLQEMWYLPWDTSALELQPPRCYQ